MGPQGTLYGRNSIGGVVNLITKKEAFESNTNYAQGGIAVVLDPLDCFDSHIKEVYEKIRINSNLERVVENIRNIWSSVQKPNITAYACGPIPMLKSATKFFNEKNVDLQISTESKMACGIGLCQGCPIKSADSEGYKLVCKEGPVFNSKEVTL